jgi:hypothetical protein
MTAQLPRIVLATPQVSLEDFHRAPDPRQACRRWARMLFEQAQLMERADPFGAAEARCAGAALLGLADAPPPAPAAPKQERLVYPADVARARDEAADWMLKFYETWPEDRPAPSGRSIEALADEEKLPWPRWILFEARNAQWPAATPLKVPYPRGVRH